MQWTTADAQDLVYCLLNQLQELNCRGQDSTGPSTVALTKMTRSIPGPGGAVIAAHDRKSTRYGKRPPSRPTSTITASDDHIQTGDSI